MGKKPYVWLRLQGMIELVRFVSEADNPTSWRRQCLAAPDQRSVKVSSLRAPAEWLGFCNAFASI